MRIEKLFYGDFRVADDLPFTGHDILMAAHKINRDYEVNVWSWPVDVEWWENHQWWVLTFTRPVPDEEYVKVVPPSDTES